MVYNCNLLISFVGSPPTPEDAKYGQVAEETNFNQQLKQESQVSFQAEAHMLLNETQAHALL